MLKKRIFAAVLSALLVASIGLTAYAMTEHFTDASATASGSAWKQWKTDWVTLGANLEQVSLTPGADQTKLNFCWYSHTRNDKPSVKLSTSADMSDAKTFTGTQTLNKVIDGVQYYSSKVTLTGLAEKKTYYYQYENNGTWSKAAAYTTKNFSGFKLLFVGDPQIGASVGRIPSDSPDAQTAQIAAQNDAYNWNATLKTALMAHPDVSFMISAGDQINYGKDDTMQQELEYSGYLGASALKSLPVATTIGNHDATTTNYKNHFNNPNPFIEEKNPTVAGNGYFYTYGNALFIFLNTNNYNCADHEALIKKAVNANPKAKWRIVTFHQDIYGSGKDHSDSDGIMLRTQLTPLMDKYDIDVVLQGHDHSYTRTYAISGDNKAHAKYSSTASGSVSDWTKEAFTTYIAQNNCYAVARNDSGKLVKPNGTVYITANSASGSKYYELINSIQNYVAARWQEWKPTYSVIEINNNIFTIDTYETETGSKIDTTFSIQK